jgi:hypothetical protein
MKSKFAMVAAGVLLAAPVWTAQAGQAKRESVRYAPTGVHIDFVHPERFTDFQLQRQSEFKTSDIFSREMTPSLEAVLARRLPGSSLTMRFTDIDLGGRYEPWRGPQYDRIRFVRNSATPIRLTFDFTLTDAQGRVVASGRQGLSDSLYLDRYPNALYLSTFDQLFYERKLLENWLNTIARG